MPQVQSLKILVSVKMRYEFVQWLEHYQELPKAMYTIRSTGAASGRFIEFKQRLVQFYLEKLLTRQRGGGGG